jgi:DNA-binding NtrC family response regulator
VAAGGEISPNGVGRGVQLPALRERGQDILTLAEHFLARTYRDYGLAPKTLAEDARAILLAYRWPGNVRELANLLGVKSQEKGA